MQLPSLDISSPKLPSLGLKLGQRKSVELVGLDIQPGYATAVQARVNGGLHIQKAAGVALPGDAMREGEVLDEGTLAEALKELFGKSHLDKRVRIGVANQRTVLRMLEMPPLPEGKELAAAVRFQAEDQMPMPLDNAVLDYHPLGIIDTPAGQRQRVAVVAAQRDMIERLLSAVRRAGLRPEAIDLSAFALIRALHRFEVMAGDGAGEPTRVLYLNVGGLTNMAIAEGTVCRFTRVVGGGLESMASAVAERHHLPLDRAREILAQVDLSAGSVVAGASVAPAGEPLAQPEVEAPTVDLSAEAPFAPSGEPLSESLSGQPPVDEAPRSAPHEAPTSEIVSPPSAEAFVAEAPTSEMAAQTDAGQSIDVRSVVENGIREIANDIRNSLDFHRTQGGGGEVASIVMSGPALAISGFSESLSAELGVQVRRQTIAAVPDTLKADVSVEHLAVAAGLAVEEAPGR